MPSKARMLRRVRPGLGPLLHEGSHGGCFAWSSYLIFICIEHHSLDASGAVAANADPASLRADDAFDFPFVRIFHCHSLHEQDPPTSDWSSLAGANGHGPNPWKRSWHSEDGPTT